MRDEIIAKLMQHPGRPIDDESVKMLMLGFDTRTVTIPLQRGERPIIWNPFYTGMHKNKRAELAQKIHQLVLAYIDRDLEPYPDGIRVDILTTFYYPDEQTCDADGVCDKVYIDGLRGWYIEDDNRRYVRRACSEATVDRLNPRVEIVLSPVPDDVIEYAARKGKPL